jgi:hypothetical protein
MAMIDTEEVDLMWASHSGSTARLDEEVARVIAESEVHMQGFGSAWGVLRRTKASDVLGVETIEEQVAEIAKLTGDVDVHRDVMVEMLLSNWNDEPGDTVADLVNAVTRTHLYNEINRHQLEQIEQSAGRLVPVLAQRAAALA